MGKTWTTWHVVVGMGWDISQLTKGFTIYELLGFASITNMYVICMYIYIYIQGIFMIILPYQHNFPKGV